MRSAIALVSLTTVLLLLSGCPVPEERCSFANCTGCCDASGQCQQGSSTFACGVNGSVCSSCSNSATCQFGTCFGGQLGGGTATGGGSGGGGGTCQARSCLDQGFTCGMASDGCGGTINCGMCDVQGESCGGAGSANVCGMGTCAAKTCASLNKNCGQVSDGCGELLSCGMCTGPEVCGGAGVANVCGLPACTARTCAQLAKNCGTVSDGCTGQLNCGTCTVQGQTCGGGGVANVCGAGTCTAQTCMGLGKNCGAASDGCGNALNCGTCSGFETCGGGGTANVCGAQCTVSCPSGFTCTNGVCAGGSLTNVTYEVPLPPQHTVSGNVTINNATPGTPAGCSYANGAYRAARLDYVHATDSRFNATGYVHCSYNSGTNLYTSNWTHSALLYPGTYKVTLVPHAEPPLPSWSTVVNAALTVSAPQTVNYEVPLPPQHVVSGNVTINNATPGTPAGCSYANGAYRAARLDYVHATDSRFNATGYVHCSYNSGTNLYTSNWTHSALLYPGTYKVTLTPHAEPPLPSWSTVVNTALTVSAPQTVNYEVPLPPQHVVSGNVTINNATPGTPAGCSYANGAYRAARLDYVHATDSRFNATGYVHCSYNSGTNLYTSNWTHSALLYPGTYKVTLTPHAEPPLPSWSTVVNTALTVSAPQTVNYEVPLPPQHVVSGNVTINNTTPGTPAGCSYANGAYRAARLDYVHATDSRFNATGYVHCSYNSGTNLYTSNWTHSALLYPGTYKVTLVPHAQPPLPSWSTVVNAALTVSAPQTVNYEVPLPPQHVVSGTISINNATPGTPAGCSYANGAYRAARLDYVHATDSRFNATGYVHCSYNSGTNLYTSNWTHSALLYPGTYKVTLVPHAEPPLPSWSTVVSAALTVSAPQTVNYEVPIPPQHTVSGTISINNTTPGTPSGCSYANGAYRAARLDYVHATDSRFNATGYVHCSYNSGTNLYTSNWTHSALLYPGTYKVTLTPHAEPPLPSWSTVVVERLRVP